MSIIACFWFFAVYRLSAIVKERYTQVNLQIRKFQFHSLVFIGTIIAYTIEFIFYLPSVKNTLMYSIFSIVLSILIYSSLSLLVHII